VRASSTVDGPGSGLDEPGSTTVHRESCRNAFPSNPMHEASSFDPATSTLVQGPSSVDGAGSKPLHAGSSFALGRSSLDAASQPLAEARLSDKATCVEQKFVWMVPLVRTV
jgi:hypothetical protein